MVGLGPLGGLRLRVEVVEHELEAEVGFVRAADARAARADRGADAARQAAEVEPSVHGASLAGAVRVDDGDVALARRVAPQRPFDGRLRDGASGAKGASDDDEADLRHGPIG